MSSYCNAYLPPCAQLRDIAQMLGIAAGLPWSWRQIASDTRGIDIPGVEIQASSIPQMPEINLYNAPGFKSNEPTSFGFTFHYEGFSPYTGQSYPPGSRLLKGVSDPHVVALVMKVVEVIGGVVDFNDDDRNYADLIVPPLFDFTPDDGDAWNKWQQKKASIVPVTLDDITAAASTVELGYSKWDGEGWCRGW